MVEWRGVKRAHTMADVMVAYSAEPLAVTMDESRVD
jgi:hypothetical protein